MLPPRLRLHFPAWGVHTETASLKAKAVTPAPRSGWLPDPWLPIPDLGLPDSWPGGTHGSNCTLLRGSGSHGWLRHSEGQDSGLRTAQARTAKALLLPRRAATPGQAPVHSQRQGTPGSAGKKKMAGTEKPGGHTVRLARRRATRPSCGCRHDARTEGRRDRGTRSHSGTSRSQPRTDQPHSREGHENWQN